MRSNYKLINKCDWRRILVEADRSPTHCSESFAWHDLFFNIFMNQLIISLQVLEESSFHNSLLCLASAIIDAIKTKQIIDNNFCIFIFNF